MKPTVRPKSEESFPIYRVRMRAGRLTLPKELLTRLGWPQDVLVVIEPIDQGFLITRAEEELSGEGEVG